jgi:adenosylmethionine-8-amino-7-oxononanoate aminotransferase
MPDMITSGKALASGYAPLGAVLIGESITELFRSGKKRFTHGFTYSGHPAACFMGQQVFDIMQRENLFSRPGSIGTYLFRRLEAVQRRHAAIGEIRGRGLYAGIEFVADPVSRAPPPASDHFTDRLVSLMRERNVIVNPGVSGMNFGNGGEHIQITPPYTITEGEVDLIVDALDDSLEQLRAAPLYPSGSVASGGKRAQD